MLAKPPRRFSKHWSGAVLVAADPAAARRLGRRAVPVPSSPAALRQPLRAASTTISVMSCHRQNIKRV